MNNRFRATSKGGKFVNYIYTATLIPNEDKSKYYCRVPDLPGCITTGNSIEDAIEMITDAASGWLVVAEDEGNEIPPATPLPAWMAALAEKRGVNCSQVLQDGLMQIFRLPQNYNV